MTSVIDQIPFKRLEEDTELLSFECKIPDLTDYFLNKAKVDQRELLSVTYYLTSENKTVVFFSLSNDKISKFQTKRGERLFTNSGFEKIKHLFSRSKHREDYPAVKIGRFGVNKDFSGTGMHWGTHTLDFIKAWMIDLNKTGCCFITVDAYATAVTFYQKNKFEFLGNKEKKAFEQWVKNHPDYRNQERFDEDIPTFAMYFNLKTILGS